MIQSFTLKVKYFLPAKISRLKKGLEKTVNTYSTLKEG